MKIISFDVGIKNMAYCIFSVKDGESPPFEIADWNVVSLLEKEEPHVYCNCASVKKKSNKQQIKNFFIDSSFTPLKNSNHTSGDLNFSTKLPVSKVCELPQTKLCCRVGKFKKGNNIYCDKHSKTQTEWLIPESRFSQKILKKTKVEDLIKLASNLKMENIGKKRVDIINNFDIFIRTRCLEPVVSSKSKSAGDTDLVFIGKKMREIFDQVLESHKDITHVLIENQISPLANRMKTIQGMLSQYFIMVYDTISIEFISSANKLKIFSSIKKEPHIEESDNTQTNREPTQSQTYKGHKKDGVYHSIKVLEKNIWISNNRWSLDTKKKDDLADCFLQGLWYLLKKENITMNEHYTIT
jgi:hypothetical protein